MHNEALNSERSARPYRPPVGLPFPRDTERVRGLATSVLAHILLIAAFILASAPERVTPDLSNPMDAGAGGIQLPAGGGGGGTRGSGGIVGASEERLQFLKIAPDEIEAVKPKEEEVIPPIKPPEVKPPEVEPPPPTVEPPALDAKSLTASLGSIDSSLIGAGGGSGNDGSSGNGPGSGGGIGSGIGTGRGSGVGPGTGGGPGTIYPPRPIQVFIPPPNPPGKITPYHVVAVFDVDTTGAVIGFDFNRSSDNGYNKKLEARLADVKWFPATDWMGRPVRRSVKLEIIVY